MTYFKLVLHCLLSEFVQDREDDARYGSAAVSNRSNFPGAALQGASEGRRGPPVAVPAAFAPPGPRGLFVTGVSYIVFYRLKKQADT